MCWAKNDGINQYLCFFVRIKKFYVKLKNIGFLLVKRLPLLLKYYYTAPKRREKTGIFPWSPDKIPRRKFCFFVSILSFAFVCVNLRQKKPGLGGGASCPILHGFRSFGLGQSQVQGKGRGGGRCVCVVSGCVWGRTGCGREGVGEANIVFLSFFLSFLAATLRI